ncbi:MAG: SCO family protein [Gammaproteobacteria bacterium]|nr:SCO family protein [Gammaproteobacteria bacterium]
MNKHRLNTFVFFAVVLLAGTGVFFSLYEPEPAPLTFPNLEGVIVESPPTPLPEFAMLDQNSQPFSKANYEGKWSLVFFGYTHCPEFCPTSMASLKRLSQQPGFPPTQFVFHTVDPKRDTVETLKDYISYFGNEFTAVTGDKAEIDKFAEPLGVIYDFDEETNPGEYIVNHFGALYIIDPKARLRAYMLPPHDVARVSEVYLKVREYYGN